jgi:16S rRNA processing protein RimM
VGAGIEVACVLGAWGVKGWIKVQCFGDDPQSLIDNKRWTVKPPEDGLVQSSYPDVLHIEQARPHGALLVAQVQGLTDRTQAQAMRGARIWVDRSEFPPAKAGEYYWVDLVGLAVFNRQGQPMGTVLGLIDTGPHSVLRLARPTDEIHATDEVERLIPFVAAYVDDVSLADRRITVDWGLDY